ncbi:MAG: DUF3189 family protein [Bacillota bacterium]|nr:DUF3189 family protein [Bacillota bacterium]
MIVVYHDVGGAHSTAVAANIHISRLPMNTIPTAKQILDVPTFDKIEKNQLGHLLYIGTDENGNRVYTLGRKYKPNLVIPAIQDMFNIVNKPGEKLYIVDTHPTVNLLMKIGGFTSRRLAIVSIGRPIVTKGTLQAYKDIANIVRGVKIRLRNEI